MTRDILSRRQILGIGGTAGVGGIGVVGYVTDNPVHRSDIERFDTRRLDGTPAVGTLWYSEYQSGSELPEASVTHLLGVQYTGIDESTTDHTFDVFGVVIGRRSTLFGERTLVEPRFLGVRGENESGTTAWDSGEVPYVRGGPLRPPETVADALPLPPERLDDEASIRRLIEDGRFPRADTNDANRTDRLWTDFRLSGALLDRYDGEHDGRLTRAGLLYGLHGTPDSVADATPPSKRIDELYSSDPGYEGRGELYSWTPGDTLAHVVRYKRLYVSPGDGRYRLRVAQLVPRPGLLGRPWIETGLVIDFPE
ncbi:hypothetical protein [Natrialba asiatica]|uniref:Uncharacterized protein n=1 Tax=Natrialba asiatica (strain ATCC 700177 / DSM 12278 / JCM 9576 / FERM P-10747 / NBRC 102637 / 172P1) TaxID=29540 RepID=M0AQP7_NATA1|nr:hypothetical protein [Natrialba asiatica]ELZ00870.1 hypothetical protein C481_11565 [Natrialba asiatica DSM 12278]